MKRSTVAACILATLPLATMAIAQQAGQAKVVVPGGPGSTADIVGRLIGAQLALSLGRPVIVENRPGAATTIGTEYVAKAAPDGNTLLVSNPSTAIVTPASFPGLRYDPKDFASITVVSRAPVLLAANPEFPAKNVREFIAYAKANPGKVNYGTLGIGTSHHVAGERLKLEAGIDIVHVPYRAGPAAAHADLMSGAIQVMFNNMNAMTTLINSGRLRLLGVAGDQRHPLYPNVPTIAESGVPGFAAYGWFGIVAPPGTPKEIVSSLNAQIVKSLADPVTRQRLAEGGSEIVANSPEEAHKFLMNEIATWGAVMKSAHITLQ